VPLVAPFARSVGSLLAPLIYLLTLRIARSGTAAALAGLFVLLDNALLVESKFILLDIFLLPFGFLSIYLFWQSTLFFADGRWRWWAAFGSAVSAGLCVSVKWTGLGFWGLLLLFSGINLARRILKREPGQAQVFSAGLMLVVVPLVLYVAFFYVHFSCCQIRVPEIGS
jgi:dolichyl-phosphate-mannose-protein mannosyltransferase